MSLAKTLILVTLLCPLTLAAVCDSAGSCTGDDEVSLVQVKKMVKQGAERALPQMVAESELEVASDLVDDIHAGPKGIPATLADEVVHKDTEFDDLDVNGVGVDALALLSAQDAAGAIKAVLTLDLPANTPVVPPKRNKPAFPGITYIDATLSWPSPEPAMAGLNVNVERNIRLVAGQTFLNFAKSKELAASADTMNEVRGNIYKAGGQFLDEPDVYAIADGHHRIIWGAFHGMSTKVNLKQTMKLASAEPMSALVYKN